MYKKMNGYFMVEATYLVPIVLLLYMLFIVGGFLLYDRCVISQDCYLLAFRAGRFTNHRENYGEIIYGEMTGKPDETYVKERLAYKTGLYPYLGEGDITVYVQNEVITVSLSGFGNLLFVSKSIPRQNPLKIVKDVRRQNNGSKIP